MSSRRMSSDLVASHPKDTQGGRNWGFLLEVAEGEAGRRELVFYTSLFWNSQLRSLDQQSWRL